MRSRPASTSDVAPNTGMEPTRGLKAIFRQLWYPEARHSLQIFTPHARVKRSPLGARSWKVKGNMNAQLSGHEEIIANYGNCPSQLEAALLGLSEINLDLRTSAEGWAIREIVHHITDGDDMWKMFIKQAIGNPDSEFFLNWYWQVPQGLRIMNRAQST